MKKLLQNLKAWNSNFKLEQKDNGVLITNYPELSQGDQISAIRFLQKNRILCNGMNGAGLVKNA